MKVNLNNKDYLVTRAVLRLQLNSGPLLYLRLADVPNGHQVEQPEQHNLIVKEVEGTFTWDDTSINFITLGFEKTNHFNAKSGQFEQGGLEIVGLVLSRSWFNWFGESPAKKSETPRIFIYQRQKDINAWFFIRRLMENNMSNPVDSIQQRLEPIFPRGVCICRATAVDNYQFLNQMITLLRQNIPEIRGWAAFNTKMEPLRLVTVDKDTIISIISLDNDWKPVNDSRGFFVNHRWIGNHSSYLARSFEVKKPAKLLSQLTSTGSRTKDIKALDEQLIPCPGSVELGKNILFCQTIDYIFEKKEDTVDVSACIEITSAESFPAELPLMPHKIEAEFTAWGQIKSQDNKNEGNQYIKLKSPNQTWAMLINQNGELQIDFNTPLFAKLLTPFAGRDDCSGLYTHFKPGDKLWVQLFSGQTPIALGQLQTENKTFESADITFNATSIAISSSKGDKKLDKANAIRLSEKEINLHNQESEAMLNLANKTVTAKAESTMEMMENVTVKKEEVSISSQTKIMENVTVKKDKLEVEASEVNITGKTTIKGNFDVG
jgi:hypothetical protein